VLTTAIRAAIDVLYIKHLRRNSFFPNFWKKPRMPQLKLILIVTLITMQGTALEGIAQTPANIKLKITGTDAMPLGNATVELLNARDTLLAKAAVSDNQGAAVFENIRPGNYFLKATMIGYLEHRTAKFTVTAGDAYDAGTLALRPESAEMKTVVVSAKKPFIQRLNDRLVVNVESSIIGAGSSAMDILERAPGVTVDQNDVIALRGRSGVIIMVDGKPTPMAGADLANYLKALPSGAIERIDIITNPSSKYDAAGNSGIIDIRMKKDQRIGMNGSFTMGYGQGVYPKANAGFTFNYRNKKINVFGNYTYNYRKGLNNLLLDRNFYENGIYNGGDLKDNYSRSPVNAHTPRIGIDYFPGKKTVIG
jgi:hypothetical protein